jgi:pyruvate/2-oxoglutarate dehydrogenase complex dihydrolipoamide acyltransferase (E2) component
MSTFIIDVPMPAMGATVSELTIITIVVAPGTPVAKGQKLAELESDKSAFDFESPADGTIVAVNGKAGDVKSSGQSLFRMETADASLQHLAVQRTEDRGQKTAGMPVTPSSVLRPLIWTPRAIKMAQEAGLDHTTLTDIAATGPGGRVSGDDVTKYLASRK